MMFALQDVVCGSQGRPLAANLLHDSHPETDSAARCAPAGKVLPVRCEAAKLADCVSFDISIRALSEADNRKACV